MTPPALRHTIFAFILSQMRLGETGVAASAIQTHAGRPRPTVNRALAELVAQGRIERQGAGRAVTYRVHNPGGMIAAREPDPPAWGFVKAAPAWSPESRALMAALSAPLGTRKPVTYRRAFVDDYRPNETHLLPAALSQELFERGRAVGQLPAGTYARKVLEQLLIDLSWFSSRLEGNRKSLLDTRELFQRGRSESDDHDAIMLLNHKEAIEFMVDAVPTEGITAPVVRNLQSLLMRDLLADPTDLGTIRQKIVHIQGSVYLPSQIPGLLEEMLGHIVDKASQIRNPIEAAFFAWVNIAYLQPFVDGNKRTSRLAANMPLMLANCAPLSFIDVEPGDYALAMIGVYERLDVTLAAQLFDWTYRRSIDKYQAIMEAMGRPDPLRARYREQLGQAMQQIVFFGTGMENALAALPVAPQDEAAFRQMLDTELVHLETYNCARYRLPMGKTQEWIARGRPR
jgi:Fic family protein